VAGSKFVNGEERGQNPKEWPVSQSDGERLKVVYMEVEMVNKGSERRSSLPWWLLCWL